MTINEPTMAATGPKKQPFKVIEVPLNKFNDEAIPHHRQLLDQHRSTVQKLMSTKKLDQLNKEIKEKKRAVLQLKDLMYELDTLRSQVEDSDLDKFDDKTFGLRKILTSLVKEYTAIQKQAAQLSETQNQINENIEKQHPFQGVSEIQIQANVSDIKLQEHEDRLKKVETIENDVQDLHGIYVDLNEMVLQQKEPVEAIEKNVEDTQGNVEEGLKQLVKASRYKTAAYPITGALFGTLVGGPVGLVAGFKIGGIAALSCGIAGYAGGRFFKKCNSDDVAITENKMNSIRDENALTTDGTDTGEKKDK